MNLFIFILSICNSMIYAELKIHIYMTILFSHHGRSMRARSIDCSTLCFRSTGRPCAEPRVGASAAGSRQSPDCGRSLLEEWCFFVGQPGSCEQSVVRL